MEFDRLIARALMPPFSPYSPPAELKATGTAHFFNFLLNTTDYRILLKDEDHDRMYVGSKDYVLSLDLHDINREPLIVSACLLGVR